MTSPNVVLHDSFSRNGYQTFQHQRLKGDNSTEIEYTMQAAIDQLGFGRFQVKISVLAGLCYMADAMEMMLLSILAPVLKCTWKLSGLQEAILTASVFFGMGLTSNFWGILSDKYGRKPVLLLFASFTGYFGILSSLSPNYWWILATRFVVGCGLGATPQAMTYYSEFLPTKFRGPCMFAIAIMWAVGSCLEAALALVVMDTLGWRWLLGISSLPLLAFSLTFKLLPESPRYHLVHGQRSQAMAVLEKIARENGSKLPEGTLLDPKDKKKDGTQWKDLFLPGRRRTTVMVTIMGLSGNMAYYGSAILTTSLFEQDDGCHGYDSESNKPTDSCDVYCKTLSKSDYVDFLITTLSEVPGILLSMFLLARLGRKKLLALLYFSYTAVMLLCNICAPRSVLVGLLFVARALGDGAAQGNSVYTAEVFPTSIRAAALGWCSSVTRAGIMMTPFLAQVLIQQSVYLSISSFALLGALGGLAAMLLPVETANSEML
ncbi:unnamed protein product [Lymnaea stagnalis]|uniref:Major facilitator superfamily (MFS) profile domain-containing protein n=1 Tax=Lymnaea stagnalis TaxID=6523 RepID=A0AAV2IAS0_LYMST